MEGEREGERKGEAERKEGGRAARGGAILTDEIIILQVKVGIPRVVFSIPRKTDVPQVEEENSQWNVFHVPPALPLPTETAPTPV